MKSWQIRLTDEEYGRFEKLADGGSLADCFRRKVFGTDAVVTGAVPEYQHAGGRGKEDLCRYSTQGVYTTLEYEPGYEPEEEPLF